MNSLRLFRWRVGRLAFFLIFLPNSFAQVSLKETQKTPEVDAKEFEYPGQAEEQLKKRPISFLRADSWNAGLGLKTLAFDQTTGLDSFFLYALNFTGEKEIEWKEQSSLIFGLNFSYGISESINRDAGGSFSLLSFSLAPSAAITFNKEFESGLLQPLLGISLGIGGLSVTDVEGPDLTREQRQGLLWEIFSGARFKTRTEWIYEAKIGHQSLDIDGFEFREQTESVLDGSQTALFIQLGLLRRF